MKIKTIFLFLLIVMLPFHEARSQDQIPPELRAQIQARVQEQLQAQNQNQAQVQIQPPQPNKNLSEADQMTALVKVRTPKVSPNEIQSLFFTAREAALVLAVRNGIIARPPTAEELDGKGAKEFQGEPGIRELTLGGIVFHSTSDWTIWLNNEKVTPKRIPKEVFDIRVHEDHIKLKWYDLYTNQIFPVKLRPHQRFNIDTRIFLPG